MGIIMGLSLYLISKIDIGNYFNSILIVNLGFIVGAVYVSYDLHNKKRK